MKMRSDTISKRPGFEIPARPDGGTAIAERVRAHVEPALERLRALVHGAAALSADAFGDAILEAADDLNERIASLDGVLGGYASDHGPGPRLTLALASELSFIARHLEAPLPPPTVERLQPRVRRAARLATLWLSPHEYNGTATYGPSSNVSTAWEVQHVKPEPADGDGRAAVADDAPAPGPAERDSTATDTGSADATRLLVERVAELRTQRDQIAERLELLDRYWRFATHELRNAAHSLVMIVEHLDSTALPNAPWLEPLGRAARSVLQRSQEALEDGTVSSGMFSVAPERVDLVELALAALNEVRTIAGQKDVRLVGERLPLGQPVWAHADPERVGQILHNLLRNAIAATPEGGFVMVEAGTIDGMACVIVSDSGPGLDPRRAMELLHLDSRAGGGERTGLGLPICRHLAEAMGGKIAPCDASPGTGTCFILSLPRSEP